ncbi:methyltransferase [Photobacterium leiognathi]|uniref:methyltransferase n=1 Tax=Photobacterium leiognathi TaxID=553611 RepID=UPI002738378F|nr:methyltransferase [Photobacterium leiognathi]
MSCYANTFQQLDTLLTANRQYWQFVPFADKGFAWEEQHPEFCDWLVSIDDQTLAHLNQDQQALIDAFMPWIPDVALLAKLAETSRLTGSEYVYPRNFDAGIPGRKWQQITAFNQVLPRLGVPWLEWCAGKGFLGRVLSVTHQQPVTSLEWQQQLCVDGEAAAKQLGLDIHFVQGDAFDVSSQQYIQPKQHAVALHACGDLHVSLIKQVVAKKGQAVSVSPCCYHLIRDKQYQPLSSGAKASKLQLSKHDLRLPLQETVTAGNRVKQLRFVEVSFRLGFDLLQREVNQTNDYLPIPNVQKALLGEGFAAFCLWAAEQKGMTLPDDINFDYWQQLGEKRFAITERMELVRQLFRRPLELWLVLDRVCFLEESDYKVTLGTFCEKQMTPRNLLIHAERM